MSDPTIPSPAPGAIDAIDPDHQAALCVAALATWLRAEPGRSAVLSHGPEGWRATLRETRTTAGTSLQDALAQAATVAAVEATS
jgi:hypothetical protein